MANSGNHGTKGKTKKYNYDPELGLMPEIEKLTSPTGKVAKSTAHLDKDPPTSNRNWKSVNTQYCIVCREGGELLCCDACPASFHLLCHEPVILRDQIPEGKWLCNRCKNTPSSDLPAKNSYDPNETEEDRNRRAFMRAMEMVGQDAEEDPLSLLAGAALAVNAQLFELPNTYSAAEAMPFDELRPSRQPVYGEQCWYCQKVVPDMILTRCDFCPGIYHLDCLDPPLCSIPKDKWMCPNHVELIVDQKLLKSQSRTERLNLWKKYARQEVNEVAILRKFVSKLQDDKQKNAKRALAAASTSQSANGQQPSTSGSNNGSKSGNIRKTVDVRLAVKEMYKDRWDGGDQRVQFATDEERDNWVNTIARMHADCTSARVLSGGGGKRHSPPEIFPIKRRVAPKRKMMTPMEERRHAVCATMKYLVNSVVKQLEGCAEECRASTSTEYASQLNTSSDDMIKEEPIDADEMHSPSKSGKLMGVRATAGCEAIKSNDVHCGSSTLDGSLKNNILNGFGHTPANISLSNEKQEPIPMNEKERVTYNLLEECKKRLMDASTPLDRQIAALAVERMEQMQQSAVVIKNSASNKRSQIKPNFDTRLFMSDMPIIAVLKAENESLPIAIQGSVTSLGTSEDCHILLSGRNHTCTVQALHHATILFDRVSNRFQLIPFNRNRVCVDGVWYGSELPSDATLCSCSAIHPDGTPIAAVQDQPAPLSHGSTITVGCTKFLFASFY